MSTFLVTGGAGFIGSHLTEELLGRGHLVLVLDDLSSGSIQNLSQVRNNPRLEIAVESTSTHRVLAELVDRADVIFHLAATVGVFNIIESPVATIVNNIGGTETLLKLAAKKRKKVLLASTSEIYGKNNTLPFKEDHDSVFGASTKSRWSYAASKLVDEFLAIAYWNEFRVPTVIVRLFNTIGPRQLGRYGMVVPRFLNQALKGEDITVYGTGRQSRCFTYVSDIVEWLLLLAGDDRAVGKVYNLGNPVEVSIAELARLVIEITGTDVGIDYISYEKAYEQGFEDMERRVPDISKVKALTGYTPTVDLRQALSFTRDWLLRQMELNAPGYSTALSYEGAESIK